jgi:hypothetical protein
LGSGSNKDEGEAESPREDKRTASSSKVARGTTAAKGEPAPKSLEGEPAAAPPEAESAATSTLSGRRVDFAHEQPQRRWRRDAALALLVAFIGLFGVGVGGFLNYWLQERAADDHDRRAGRTALLLMYDDMRRNVANLRVAEVTNRIPDALPLTTKSWDEGRGDAARVLSTRSWLALSTSFAQAAAINDYSEKRDHPSEAQARKTIQSLLDGVKDARAVIVRALKDEPVGPDSK